MTLRNPSHYLLALLILLCLSVPQKIFADHIVGGDLTYSFVQFNSSQTSATFEFTLNLYRDTSPTSSRMPSSSTFGVFRQLPSGTWQFVTSATANRSPIIDVPFIENPCREEPTYFVGVETASFVTSFELPIIGENYMVVSKRCCRNFTINNIDTDDVGATFDVVLTPEAQRVGNNSVQFTKYPPIFVCTALTLNEDVSGTDPEGDSLTYELCTPLNSSRVATGCGVFNGITRAACVPPFDEVVYNPGFSAAAPMGGDPVVGINPTTGLMTGIPTTSGQYVVGMCIKEYRDGKLLSIVRRDFQFNTIPCGEELKAIIGANRIVMDSTFTPAREIYEIDICGPDDAVVLSQSTGGTVIYSYEWMVNDIDGEMLARAQGINFDRVGFPLENYGEYDGELILNNGLDCPDTAYFKLFSNPSLEADFGHDQDSCFLASMSFTDASSTFGDGIVGWEWDFDNESSSSEKNPIYKFQDRGIKTVSLVAIDHNKCRDTTTQIIDYNPLFDQDLPIEYDSKLICYGDSVWFINEYVHETGSYLKRLKDDVTGCDTLEVIWDIAFFYEPVITEEFKTLCANSDTTFHGQFIDREGSYSHKTPSVTSDCDSIIELLEVTIYPEIELEFNLLPLFDCFPGRYAIAGTSSLDPADIVYTEWDLGDGTTYTDQNNFFHEFATRGDYVITMYIEDALGCSEIIQQTISYSPPYEEPERIEEEMYLCDGDSLFFNNQWIGSSGTYKDKIQYAGTACDSLFRTWNISVAQAPVESFIDTMKCPEDVLSIFGVNYSDESEDIISQSAKISGCDSVIYYVNVSHHELVDIEFPANTIDLPEFVDRLLPIEFSDEVQNVSWTGEGLDCTDCPYPSVNYSEDGTYSVSLESTDGCENRASIFVNFIEVQHYIPNIIDPNATDEINRCFVVQKPEYALKTEFYDLRVFDRWGGTVFDRENLRINDSSDCFTAEGYTAGVYLYHIQIHEPDGKLDFTGTLTVLP